MPFKFSEIQTEQDSGHCRNSTSGTKRKYPEKPVWCYTGFRFDELLKQETAKKMLGYIDVLVDGKFVEELKSADLIFRGSSNQRIIDVKKSLETGGVVWLEGIWRREMGSGDIYK